MRHDNPAVFECAATKSKIHHWQRRDDGTSYCFKCNTELTKEQTADVWYDHNR